MAQLRRGLTLCIPKQITLIKYIYYKLSSATAIVRYREVFLNEDPKKKDSARTDVEAA